MGSAAQKEVGRFASDKCLGCHGMELHVTVADHCGENHLRPGWEL